MTTKNYYRLKLGIYIFTSIALIGMFIGYMYGGVGRANNSQQINESFTPNINKIEIDIISIPILIEKHEGNEIIVEANIKNSTYKEPIIVSIFGKTLEIRHPRKKLGISLYRSFGSGTITIKVPAQSKYDYEIDSVSADIEIYATGQEIEVDGVSGKIKLFTPVEKLDVHTVSGNIELFAPVENLDANTVSGTLKATADSSSREFNLDTVSGSMYIYIEDSIGYTIDIDSVSGSVIDEYNNRTSSREGTYTIGDGTLKITVDTISGHIKLADWQ